MEFNKYQEKAKETAEYPVLKHKWVYPSMGLAGESGEVVEKLKKIARNKNRNYSIHSRYYGPWSL